MSEIRIIRRRRRRPRTELIQGVTKPAINRIMRRAGVKRASGLIYAETRAILKSYLEEILRDAITYQSYAKRRTLFAKDVNEVLKRRPGRPVVWGVM